MKATLTFDLDNPDDRMAHARCVKSLDMAMFLTDFAEELRRADKYSDAKPESWEAVRQMFHDKLRDNGVDLDELIA